MNAPSSRLAPRAVQLGARYRDCRQDTLALLDGLCEIELERQSAPDTRCAKWHLAHTSWFFEQHVLGAVDGHFGAPSGARRDALPSLAELLAHRRRVDEAVGAWLDSAAGEAGALRLEHGIEHEWQHQEWLLADLRHPLQSGPPAPRSPLPVLHLARPLQASWVAFRGGRVAIGRDDDDGFSFACEQPCHERVLKPMRWQRTR
jgi:hypothetical protein